MCIYTHGWTSELRVLLWRNILSLKMETVCFSKMLVFTFYDKDTELREPAVGINIHSIMPLSHYTWWWRQRQSLKCWMFFWVVTSCGLIGRYQNFKETYCLHLQGAYVSPKYWYLLWVHTASQPRTTILTNYFYFNFIYYTCILYR
jgi:hypothetical protein